MLLKPMNPKLIKKISQLEYPYLNSINSDSQSTSMYLTQVDEIARNAYTQDTNIETVMSFSKLHDCYMHSPKSWKVFKENNTIRGFVHVQALNEYVGLKLMNGEIDEIEISNKDILADDSQEYGYIHIGSIVSKDYPSGYNDKLPYYLIAGVVDRILDLRENNPKLKTILTTDFEDSMGDRHFKDILPKYGFESIGKTPSGDTIYKIELESSERRFSQLIDMVVLKRIESYEKKQQIEKMKKLATSIPDIIIRAKKLLSSKFLPDLSKINISFKLNFTEEDSK